VARTPLGTSGARLCQRRRQRVFVHDMVFGRSEEHRGFETDPSDRYGVGERAA
jgi:hypothetical protein